MNMQFLRHLSRPARRSLLISRPVQQQQQQHLPRCFHASAALGADLPYHIVVGLPALSPTMDTGALAEWYVAEGDSFTAGDVLAKIETDKASMDFEAQDDGHVAKLLLQADGKDIPVGEPIMISVEEEEHIAAFKDYVHQAAPPPPPAEEKPAAAAPPPPPKAAVVEAPPPPPVAAAPPPPVPAAAVATPAPKAASGISMAMGVNVTKTSPLAKTLAANQTDYVEKYGTTGQRPIL